MENLSDRQKEIINTSIKIIAKNGIQHLTIKNISKSIKISEPAIYRHFDSKMDILKAILNQFKGNSKSISSEINSLEMSPIKKIEEIYVHHFKMFIENPALAAVIFSEEIFQDDKQLSNIVRTIMQSNQNLIIEIIKEGQQSKEIRTDIPESQLGIIIMGALRLIVNRWQLSKHSFDLEKEGLLTFNSIKKLIKSN